MTELSPPDLKKSRNINNVESKTKQHDASAIMNDNNFQGSSCLLIPTEILGTNKCSWLLFSAKFLNTVQDSSLLSSAEIFGNFLMFSTSLHNQNIWNPQWFLTSLLSWNSGDLQGSWLLMQLKSLKPSKTLDFPAQQKYPGLWDSRLLSVLLKSMGPSEILELNHQLQSLEVPEIFNFSPQPKFLESSKSWLLSAGPKISVISVFLVQLKTSETLSTYHTKCCAQLKKLIYLKPDAVNKWTIVQKPKNAKVHQNVPINFECN